MIGRWIAATERAGSRLPSITAATRAASSTSAITPTPRGRSRVSGAWSATTTVAEGKPRGEADERLAQLGEPLLRPTDAVHLVHAHDEVRRDEEVATRLLGDAALGVHEEQRDLRGRCAGTVFRVYCPWPGVSARMKRRRGVAK